MQNYRLYLVKITWFNKDISYNSLHIRGAFETV